MRPYRFPDSWDLTLESVTAFRAVMGPHWSAIMRRWIASNTRYDGYEWETIDETGDKLFAEANDDGAGLGATGDGTLPWQIAGLVILRTGTEAPQRSRGLQYLPFVWRGHVGPDGDLNDGGLAVLQDLGDLIARPLVDSLARVWQPVVWRRSTGELWDVSGSHARRQLAQQRRRGPYWPPPAEPIWV